MKNKFLILVVLFSVYASAQTKSQPISKDDIFNKVSKSAAEFAQMIISKNNFDTYFEISRKNSVAVINQSLSQFNGKMVSDSDLLGYVVNIKMKSKFLPNEKAVIDLNLFVDPTFKVYFDKNWSGTVDNGISENNIAAVHQILPSDQIYMFIGALNVYAVALEKNRVLTKDQVVSLADNTDHGKKWGVPILRQNSIPDFAIYCELMETDCLECEKIDIKVDQEIILNTTAVNVDKR